jgi:hypothetical protein
MKINEYAPNITTGQDGFTVLAHSEEMATKEILTYINAEDFDGIDLIGSWDTNNWETKDRLERQDFY